MTFRKEVLCDRYTTFNKYREISPFYDDELASHIILRFEDVITTLRSTSVSSNRKKQQFDRIKHCPFSQPLVEFYSQWLMYMDGEEHSKLRKLITIALSKATKNIENVVDQSFFVHFEKLLSCKHQVQDIVSVFSAPFVTSVLAAVFGISEIRYSQIISISKPIVMFLGSGDVGDVYSRKQVIDSLNLTHDVLLSCIHECNSCNSVIGYLLQKNVSVADISPLLINIVIDGYDPFLSAVNAYLLNKSKNAISDPNNHMSSNQIFDEITRLETPFQYCARIATEDLKLGSYSIRQGERIMAFIASANRDPNCFYMPEQVMFRDQKIKSFSFGAGRHICPGGNLARKSTARLIDLFSKFEEKVRLVHVEDKWMDSFGFRFLEKLRVEVVIMENIT
ncbi:cytochrome P450 [Salmonella enterica]|nr:cytochrome P450 [Salmonella enterica]